MATQQEVLAALGKVRDPQGGKDVVSLGAIQDVTVRDGRVGFRVVLEPASWLVRDRIEAACREAVAALPGVQSVQITPGVSVAGGRPVTGKTAIEGVKHVIAIASGKGGVGKSTVAVNLAVALHQFGATVGLLDADIYGPSIPMMMGINRMPESAGNRIQPLENHGVRLMSLGFLLPPGSAPVIWRGPMVAQAIQQFLREVDWGRLDYLLVDLPPGTGDAQLTLCQQIPLSGVVVVMTPQDVAVGIASKALAMFRQLKVPVLGIVENMGSFLCPHCGTETPIFSTGGGRRAAEQLGVPFLGSIPLDAGICETGDAGQPILVREPAAPVSGIVRAITAKMAAIVSDEAADAGPQITIVGRPGGS
jgi:ATP-binding protein involved in chromosome partitioning